MFLFFLNAFQMTCLDVPEAPSGIATAGCGTVPRARWCRGHLGALLGGEEQN